MEKISHRLGVKWNDKKCNQRERYRKELDLSDPHLESMKSWHDSPFCLDYRNFYTQDLKEKVGEYFKKDVENFKYKIED